MRSCVTSNQSPLPSASPTADLYSSKAASALLMRRILLMRESALERVLEQLCRVGHEVDVRRRRRRKLQGFRGTTQADLELCAHGLHIEGEGHLTWCSLVVEPDVDRLGADSGGLQL